jgi:hypothetical protein
MATSNIVLVVVGALVLALDALWSRRQPRH